MNPLADRAAEADAVAHAPEFAEAGAANPGFAETLDTAPALLLVLADLAALATIDRDLPRYTFVGGASIYPFVWSLLLAARSEGLGGVTTTVAIRREADVQALFAIPDTRGGGRPGRARPSGDPAAPADPGAGQLLRLGRPLRGHAAGPCLKAPIPEGADWSRT